MVLYGETFPLFLFTNNNKSKKNNNDKKIQSILIYRKY